MYRVIDSAWFNQTGAWTKNSCNVVVGDFDGNGRNEAAFSHPERPDYTIAWYGSAPTWIYRNNVRHSGLDP